MTTHKWHAILLFLFVRGKHLSSSNLFKHVHTRSICIVHKLFDLSLLLWGDHFSILVSFDTLYECMSVALTDLHWDSPVVRKTAVQQCTELSNCTDAAVDKAENIWSSSSSKFWNSGDSPFLSFRKCTPLKSVSPSKIPRQVQTGVHIVSTVNHVQKNMSNGLNI